MILPIYAYGQPVLRKVANPINKDYPDLEQLIQNMWETMYEAEGIGLAAPQVGIPIRLFVIDTSQLETKIDGQVGFKKVFINAEMIEEVGEVKEYEEGCLSIPDIRGDVKRLDTIHLKYYDENWKVHEETYEGWNARVIQHEYDHIDGHLFVEKLKPIKKRRIKRKLEAIKKGMIDIEYKMKIVRS